jgi:hypothetical protein
MPNDKVQDDKAVIEMLRMELRTLRTELTVALERMHSLEHAIEVAHAIAADKDRVS